MMFLEFFIWGGWFVTMGTFLSQSFNATGLQLANAYETQSIGAIIAPFIIGLIADRYFSAQKILGFLHLIGAFLLYMAGSSNEFSSFYPFVLFYMILYMPTLALVNSVAFRQMRDPSKEFPPIRVFGTVGWIIAGLVNVGMWFERFNIVGSSLQHEYIPHSWGEYWPTIVETGVTIGSFGFFFTLFTLFVKSLPPMAIMELKEATNPPMKKPARGHK